MSMKEVDKCSLSPKDFTSQIRGRSCGHQMNHGGKARMTDTGVIHGSVTSRVSLCLIDTETSEKNVFNT